MSATVPPSPPGRVDHSRAMTDHAPILLGDIGGTTARFALLESGSLGPIAHFAVAEHRDLDSAVAAFLALQHRPGPIARPRPMLGAILGLAGPVEDGRCEITNSRWQVDAGALRTAFGLTHVQLLNDFEVTAWSLPKLTVADLRPIGGGEAVPGAPMVVVGPGTGLGIAALVPHAGSRIVVPTEGGHADLPGTSAREDAIIDRLRKKYGHVSAERVLSGRGLEDLYATVASLDGASVPTRSAAEITAAALADTCPTARAALDTFCAMLGTLAGNLALLFRARGGVYIAGGIVPRIVAHLARSDFRTRFAAKGRFEDYVAAIPTCVIVHPDPAFLGLKYLAENLLASSAAMRPVGS